MIVHQFEACYEDVQELLRARAVETGVAEGLNALALFEDAAFPCLGVSHRDRKVAVYHFFRHHAVYVRNAPSGEEFPRYLPPCHGGSPSGRSSYCSASARAARLRASPRRSAR